MVGERRRVVGARRKLQRLAGAAAFLGTLAACDGEPLEPPEASLVFVNGDVVTMATGGAAAEAVAIAGDRLLGVGSTRMAQQFVGPGTDVIDLEGRTVLPGFVDAHTHLFNDAEQHLGLTLAGAQALALEHGITTLGDLFVTEDFLAQMRAFEATGQLKVRTSLYLIHTDNCGFEQGGTWWTAYPPTREFGERLRVGGIKAFADGGTCGAPAVSVEFEPGSGFGDLFLTAEDVAAIVSAAEGTGHQVVIHASGDRAVQAAQDGIALALEGRPNARRHRIDHNSVVPAELIPRYAEIGIHPVLFGWRSLGACVPSPPPELYQEYWGNTRLMLDRLPQMHVAWHGDDPWVGPVSPFHELHNMVTRIRRLSDGTVCPPPDWQLPTRISAAEGLRMMTRSSAYALFREAEVGSLEPGKLADLIVVTGNPLAVAPEDLWQIRVSVTIVGGEVLYCGEDSEFAGPLCPAGT